MRTSERAGKPVKRAAHAAVGPVSVHPNAVAARPAADRAKLLDRARRLADEAAFDDAWSLCEELAADGPDVEIYYLKGLISAARDRLPSAEDCFRRALYLDPTHYESLVQMSLLCERLGEPARAGLFRDRAARLASRKDGIDARKP